MDFLKQGAEMPQNMIPEGMAVTVIDLLEMIQVHHEAGKGPAFIQVLAELDFESLMKETVVPQSRQFVPGGQ